MTGKRRIGPLVFSLVALVVALGALGLAIHDDRDTVKAPHITTPHVTAVYGKPAAMCASTPSNAGASCTVASSSANCPPGTSLTGGGWTAGAPDGLPGTASVEVDGPVLDSSNVWVVQMQNNVAAAGSFEAVAYCERR
jgi:hypothetical protein